MKTKLFLSTALSLCLCAASMAQTLPAYLPTDGLVGWWPFNGNANDESGNGNNGIPTNITYGIDRFGNSNSTLEILGQSNRIVTIQNPTNLGSNKKTFSAWIKFPGSLNPGLWYNYILLCEPSIGYGAWLSILGNNPLYIQDGRMYKFNYTGLGQPQEDPSDLFNTNTWRHIACIADMDSAMVKFYFDGIFAGSKQITIDQNLTQWNAIKFGNNLSDPNAAFAGSLDDIAIYNRALTPEEITALYTGEQVNPPAACNPLPSNLQNGLVGYWPFCGNANDESGNGNDGTVNGATLTEDRFGVANAAYSFDAVDDWIDVLNNQGLNSASGTVSAWLKSNGELFNDQQLIFGQYQSRPQLIVNTNNNQKASISWPSSNGDNANATSTSLISSGEWISVIGTYSSNNIKIYINGVFEAELITELTQSNCFSSIYNIGGFNATNQTCGGEIGQSQFFNGNIDDIGIWNRAITPDEVQQLYTLNTCTFTIYDTTNVTIYDTVSVSVSTTDTLIINTLITAVEPAQENTFLVYPNPASTQITINNGNVAILGGYTMRITNSLGQDVYNQNITQPQVTLDLSTWSGNGLYVLYIVDPQQNIVAVKQIVLQ